MKPRWIKGTALWVSSIILAACAHPTHPWLARPPAVVPEEWVDVAYSHIRWFVSDDKEKQEACRRAMERLRDNQWVELSAEDASDLWAAGKERRPVGQQRNGPVAGRAFLLRGVRWGGVDRCNVRQNKNDGSVWVSQGSSNGEMMGSSYWPMSPSPIIAYLDAPPTKVYVTAWQAGDGI